MLWTCIRGVHSMFLLGHGLVSTVFLFKRCECVLYIQVITFIPACRNERSTCNPYVKWCYFVLVYHFYVGLFGNECKMLMFHQRCVHYCKTGIRWWRSFCVFLLLLLLRYCLWCLWVGGIGQYCMSRYVPPQNVHLMCCVWMLHTDRRVLQKQTKINTMTHSS